MSDFSMIFPGQGSQSIGMLSNLYNEFNIIVDTFKEANEILQYDLWKLVSEEQDKLNQTIHTQPALLTAGVACWRCWLQEKGRTPKFVAGHSLGEYSALVAAGVLTFSDALILVRARADAMQRSIPEGTSAMAAILGLAAELVIELCEDVTDLTYQVSAANFNDPGQTVITGHLQAVEKAMEKARLAGAKRCVKIPVSIPSHCSLMERASSIFAEHLNATTFTDGQIPVVQNVDAQARTDKLEIKKALLAQLCEPVQWVNSITYMKESGIKIMVECGPNKVLSGLNKRINKQLTVFQIGEPSSFSTAIASLELRIEQ